MPFYHPNPAPISDLGSLLDVRNRIESHEWWGQQQFEHGHQRWIMATLALACENTGINASYTVERRLTRMLAKHLPLGSPWRIKSEPVIAQRRFIAFYDDRRTRDEDATALIDRTIQHLACTVPQFVSV